jgi:predicted  nucleic acid-binding Zn-ribbon protein
MKTINKQLSGIMKTFQDINVEIESSKKSQTDIKVKMKNLESQTKSSEESPTNTFQAMERRILSLEDKIEEVSILVKENVK